MSSDGLDETPHHFRCPISLEIMWDPVTVSTGHTFDRPSIEAWLSTGNSTCPVTRSPLSSDLIPNFTLSRLIRHWFPSFAASIRPHLPPAAAPSLIYFLLTRSSPASGLQAPARVAALARLSRLVRDSDENKSLLSSIPETRDVLTSILFSSEPHSAELRNESLALLVQVQLGEAGCDSVASDTDRIGLLVRLMLEPNTVAVRANAAAVIEAVLAGTTSPELRSRVAGSEGVFEGVVAVMRDGIFFRRAVKVGVKALFELCLDKQNRERAVAAGAAEAVVDLLANSADLERADAEGALATAEMLCRLPEGCATFAANPMTAPVLVRTIHKVSDRATEHAAGALLAVCTASERAKMEAVEAGMVARLVVAVLRGCTVRGKMKVLALLKLVRDWWPEDSVEISDVADPY